MTLGGSTFVHNGLEFDYNFRETIFCLSELCDKFVVVDAGSTDGTRQVLFEMAMLISNMKLITISEDGWDAEHGREKLSYFSNIAIDALDTDWNFYLQADEVLHEDSFPYVRKAIENDQANGYLIRRHNLWKDCNHILNVEQSRKPCSTDIVRLARTKYHCVGDAESIGVTDGIVGLNYLNKIEIYHMGFVRKREVMKAKIINMQEKVFEIDHDKRLDESEIFDPMRYFSESDLITLQSAGKTLPKFIQEWAKTRP